MSTITVNTKDKMTLSTDVSKVMRKIHGTGNDGNEHKTTIQAPSHKPSNDKPGYVTKSGKGDTVEKTCYVEIRETVHEVSVEDDRK